MKSHSFQLRWLILISVPWLIPAGVNSQTIPKDKLSEFVASVHLTGDREAGEEPADLEFDFFEDYSFASAPADVDRFIKAHCKGEDCTVVGVGLPNKDPSNRDEMLELSALPIKEKNETITIFNDCLGFERQDAIIAVWKNIADSLQLDFILHETFPTGIGVVYLDGHGLFPDSSILLVIRQYSENYQTLKFLRVTDDGDFQQLYVSEEFYVAWKPGQHSRDFRGYGYTLEKHFSALPILHISQVKTVSLPNEGVCTIIDKSQKKKAVNLWDLIRK